ncbi:MAG: acyl-CoA dehydrogenase family protein [Acidimicrobiia bacterium]
MMDAAELDLVRSSLRHLLTTAPPADLPHQLIEAGWRELIADDPNAVTEALFTEQGAAHVSGPALELVMLDATDVEIDPTNVALVLPPLRRGVTVTATRIDNNHVSVDGLLLAGADRAAHLVVTDGSTLWSVPMAACTATAVGGFDPALGLTRVHANGVDAVVLSENVDWAGAVAAGRRALSCEMIAAARHWLTETVAYVTARVQYRRPIGSFQSVQHRLADAHIALSAATDAVVTAFEEHDAWTALLVKALAGRSSTLAIANCFQVTGGIAFTAEHDLHHAIERIRLLDALLGGHEELTWTVGERILADPSVPRLPRL